MAHVNLDRYADSPVAPNKGFTKVPTRLLYPIDQFPVKSPHAQKIFDSFVSYLQANFDIIKEPVNMTELLTSHLPDSNFTKFQQYSNTLAEYQSWFAVGKPLTEEYVAQFGVEPSFDPVPVQMFLRAKRYAPADYERAVKIRDDFLFAIGENLFRQDPSSCSDSIFIYDTATGGLPSYRKEEYNSLPGATSLLLTRPGPDSKVSESFHYLASMAGLPDVGIPLGQVEYFSHISQKSEYLPISLQLVTRRGCDEIIMSLIEDLTRNGFLRTTQTGAAAFNYGKEGKNDRLPHDEL
jgi:Asp-tRNA(Asn)/Glu-tRNA(Gln) amidotransferase A subunit family amidase